MTAVELVILESFPEQFGLSWDRVYAPAGYSVTHYEVVLTDEMGSILKRDIVEAAASESSYNYIYPLKQGLSTFPECTLRKFSVSAVTTAGTTESSSVSWKKPKSRFTENVSYNSRSYELFSYSNTICYYLLT